MTQQANSVGATRIIQVLLGEERAARWGRPILRIWGFLFVAFVFLFVWLPSEDTPVRSLVLRWIILYTAYVLCLEILSRRAKRLYETSVFRLFRIQFNLVMVAILMIMAPPAASDYLWFFLSLPILAALVYFGRLFPLLAIYLEVCIATLIVVFAQGRPTALDFAAVVAQDAILGLVATVLYFLVRFLPRLREEETLLKAATTLMNVLDRKELCQLLADAAKVGVQASDAAVVHLLGGEENKTLVPLASSHLDITALGKTLMEVGSGIAGYAIQNHETINVPDVNEDTRYLQLPPSFTPFESLLVASMYVGDKDIGTISVHSAKKGAFGEREERFLTTLAAQGATAIANAELYGIQTRRRQQISDILEASHIFGLNQPPDVLWQTIVDEVCRCSGYRMAVVNLLNKDEEEAVVKAVAGVPSAARSGLEGVRVPLDKIAPLIQDEFRVSRSYFIRYDRRPSIPEFDRCIFTPDLGDRQLGEWHPEDVLVVPMQTREEELLGYIFVGDPSDRQLPALDTVQALEILASVAAGAIRNALLYEGQQRRSALLSLINQIGRQVTAVLELQTVLARATEAICQSFGYESAAVFMVDETDGDLALRAVSSVSDIGLGQYPHAIGGSVIDWVAENAQTLVRNSVSEHPRLPPPHPASGEGQFQAELAVPIRVGDAVIGVLDVRSVKLGVFDDLDIEAMEKLADQLAVAVENARLYQEVHQRVAQLALINDIGGKIAAVHKLDSVLDRAANLVQKSFGYHHVGLFTSDRKRAEMLMAARAGDFVDLFPPNHRIKLGQGMVGWVGCHGDTLLAKDVQADSRYINFFPDSIPTQSELSVPVRVGEDVVGVLDVQSPQLNAFDGNDVMVMETLADQVAVAIENARLYEVLRQELNERRRAEEMLRQRNQELELLNRAGRTFSSTLDLDHVLETILEKIRRLLDVHASAVWLIEPETDALVCHHAVGPGSGIIQRWSLAPGEGLAGWVARTGESLIVPDTRLDDRYFAGLERRIGLSLRSILSVPLWLKERVIGVLQMVDTEVDRFKPTDLKLLELLAANAAIAIENARLFAEANRLSAFNENIVQSMEEGVLLEDAVGRISFINPKAAELLNYSPEELIGQHWTVTAAPEEVAAIKAESAKRRQGVASRYETFLLTKEGQRVPVIVSATPLFNEESFTGVLSTFTDITDRKRQETRLQEYLSTVTNNLAHHTSLKGLYKFIVEAGARFLSARDCCLFLISDEGDDVLELVAGMALPRRTNRPRIAISNGPDCGIVAHVARTCQPIRLLGEDVFHHASWNEKLWTRVGWDSDLKADSSLLAAPMRLHDGRLIGVLIARDAESPCGFSKFDEVLLKTLATNAAADIERVRGLAEARETAIRVERKRLEADLHEAMNVLITGVRWESEIVSEALACGDLVTVHVGLRRLEAALTRAYTDLRYLLQDLRDPTLEREGLMIALEKRAELIGRGRIVVQGELQERLPPEVQGVLYRVGQEAMSNAVKHSRVLRDPDVKIELCLEWNHGDVQLRVEDNGMGFDVESTLSLTHKWGLRRLRDIVQEIGGQLDIDSTPEKGTTICATIGLKRGENGAWCTRP